jgi:hypothetical protein
MFHKIATIIKLSMERARVLTRNLNKLNVCQPIILTRDLKEANLPRATFSMGNYQSYLRKIAFSSNFQFAIRLVLGISFNLNRDSQLLIILRTKTSLFWHRMQIKRRIPCLQIILLLMEGTAEVYQKSNLSSREAVSDLKSSRIEILIALFASIRETLL